MDIIGIFILVAVILILYQLTQPNINSKDKFNGGIRQINKYDNNSRFRPYVKSNPRNDVYSQRDTVNTSNINPNFIYNQFHNDYRDVITGINNIVPQKKQLFNVANTPVKYSEPEPKEVSNLVKDFVKTVNENIKTQVPNQRNPNSGWDEAIPDPNVKSGWDTVQESLGLVPSLWNKPSGKTHIKLIDVSYVQKYETEDEIKYTCDIILQKVGVNDQMVLKVSFVIDKSVLHDENNFFLSKNIEMRVTIEDVHIQGYLSREGTDARLIFDNDVDKFFDYDKMEQNNMTDPRLIQKTLMDKYKQRTLEMEQRNATLDEEGQAFHRELPHMYDFSNIAGTQTIFDDYKL